MRDPHRGVGLVDVLAAGPAGPIGVDLEIVIIDLDLVDGVHHRRDLDPGEARLAAVRSIERGQADQAVDALLAAIQPVGVLALDQEAGRLDACLLSR